MNKIYLILDTERIPIGFFVDERDRDNAFHHHFIEGKDWTGNVFAGRRWAIKGER